MRISSETERDLTPPDVPKNIQVHSTTIPVVQETLVVASESIEMVDNIQTSKPIVIDHEMIERKRRIAIERRQKFAALIVEHSQNQVIPETQEKDISQPPNQTENEEIKSQVYSQSGSIMANIDDILEHGKKLLKERPPLSSSSLFTTTNKPKNLFKMNEKDDFVESQPTNSMSLSRGASSSMPGLVYARFRVLSVQRTEQYLLLELLHRKSKIQTKAELHDSWLQTEVISGDVINIIWSDAIDKSIIESALSDGNESKFLQFRINQDKPGVIIINDNKNFIIVRPDELVSPTRIGDSTICIRRPILSEKLTSGGDASKLTVIGNLKHDLFEKSIIEVQLLFPNIYPNIEKRISSISKEILSNPEMIQSLYAVGVSHEEAAKELESCESAILNWIKEFWNLAGSGALPASSTSPFNKQNKIINFGIGNSTTVKIEKLLATEEMIWSPLWGLKGALDATVKAHITYLPDAFGNQLSQQPQSLILPVELKTGYSIKAEHHAQVSLYSLLVNDKYFNVDKYIQSSANPLEHHPSKNNSAGLIVHFTKANSSSSYGRQSYGSRITGSSIIAATEGVRLGTIEVRQLIQKRNTIASYIVQDDRYFDEASKFLETHGKTPDSLLQQRRKPSYLPSVIGNVQGECTRCFQKDICMLHHYAMENGTPETSGLSDIEFNNLVGHCASSHINYLRKWLQMIDLEEQSIVGNQSEIWRLSGIKRESLGRCISHMTILDKRSTVGDKNDGYIYRFVRHKDAKYIFASHSKSNQTKGNEHFTKRMSHTKYLLSSLSSFNENSSSDDTVKIPILELSLLIGDSVVLGIENAHFAIARGKVVEITEDYVDIETSSELIIPDTQYESKAVFKKSKDLEDLFTGFPNLRVSDPHWRIDKDEILTGLRLVRSGLLTLFVPKREPGVGASTFNDEQAKRLRRLVIDMQPPSFCDMFEEPGSRFVRDATGSQIANVLQVVNKIEELRHKLLDDDFQVLRTNSERNELRQLLVDKMLTLNEDQIKAVASVLAAHDYVCIQGMPGTGKTTTIAIIVLVLYLLGKSVLVTAYTHTAVDNLLIKLRDFGVNTFVRLGIMSHVHPSVRSNCLGYESSTPLSIERLNAIEHDPNIIVGATCMGVIKHPVATRRRFDYCIIDEAGQLTQPICIAPLSISNVFVLVGDHLQLPPLVKSEKAKEMGMDHSLFSDLAKAHSDAVISLTYQFRMNAKIMLLANELIYHNLLKCGNDFVANGKLILLGYPDCLKNLALDCGIKKSNIDWISDIIDPNREVVFLDTDGAQEAPVELEQRPGKAIMSSYSGDHMKHSSTQNDMELQAPTTSSAVAVTTISSTASGPLINVTEACVVRDIVRGLTICGASDSDIGIITPYRSQLRVLRNHLEMDQNRYPLLEVETVDKYQGRDKLCIIVSLVRSNLDGTVGTLLQDWRRLNVAFTRAKCKLIVIGSGSTLRASPICSSFLDLVVKQHWVYDLPPWSLNCDQHQNVIDDKLKTTLSSINPSCSSTSTNKPMQRNEEASHRMPSFAANMKITNTIVSEINSEMYR